MLDMTETIDLQAEIAVAIAERLDEAGFNFHDALAVLGIVVRLFMARIPDTVRDDDIADWANTFLHTPCPFNGHLDA
jgi:hypothetical protein